MLKTRTEILFLFLMLTALSGFTQSPSTDRNTATLIRDVRTLSYWDEDTSESHTILDTTFYLFPAKNCKSLVLMPVFSHRVTRDSAMRGRGRKPDTKTPVQKTERTPFIRVHGSMTYDYYYQSHSDTPYMEKDIHQHTVQAVLDVTLRNRYPMHLVFSTSKGNSAYFKDLAGLQLRYSNRDFRNQVLRRAEQWNDMQMKDVQLLQLLKDSISMQWEEINRLRGWLSDPGWLQRSVEQREAELYGRKQPEDVFGGLSAGTMPFPREKMRISGKWLNKKVSRPDTLQRFQARLDSATQVLDSLRNRMAGMDRKYREQAMGINDRRKRFAEILRGTRSNRELAEKLGSFNLPDSVLPKGYKMLLSLKSVGIGRTMLDYSELTVKNISITGFQAEYNPGWYFAAATGSVNYRFRDFVVNNSNQRQYVSIARAGLGMKEGNNIILSMYGGKRQLYNFNTDAEIGTGAQIPDNHIMGVSLEGRWQIGKNHFITGEVAKSSMPYYTRESGHGAPGGILRFDDHSNEAYALKAFSFIPATNTRITGMYKRMAGNFQSFSIYTTGSSQTAWMMQAEQPFFKRQLIVTAGIRKNVFETPFQNMGYRSSTAFKSIQATFRRKKLPVVSLGYFPSSQLMKLGEGRFTENLFYTMVGNVSHFYSYRNISMSTMLSATRFYNSQADSNFVYFNSTNIMLVHTMFLGALTLNGGLSSALSGDYALYGIDGSGQYEVNKWLGLGLGMKYNYQTVYNRQQLGYSGSIRLTVPRIGEISMMADKSFLPGAEKQLVENKSGRLTYTRIF